MINEIKNSRAPEALIDRLGVFELRGLAREMGIPSPTTKKRDELVALILENFEKGGVQEGKVQRRGRPFKKLASLEEIISSVKETETKSEMHYDGILRFAQEQVPFFTSYGESERIEGVARKTERGAIIYSLTSPAKVFVGDIYALEKIENGDIVELTGQRVNDQDYYKALSISLINGISATSYQRKEAFEHGSEIISQKEISLAGHKAFEGRRNACLIEEDLYENEALSEIYKYAQETNSKLVLIGANTSFENQIYFKQFGLKWNFTTPYGTDAATNLNKVINGLNYAENCFQNGENVIAVVTDLGGTLLALDESFDVRDSNHARETQVIAKKMLSLAGAYESGKNFTLILFYSEMDKDDKFIGGDLLRVCKRC
ncbi:MAG: hypothetical protein J6A28_01200 [Clostridia bacterium]|nr:hypothetical protein [Clostridia bacterium]